VAKRVEEFRVEGGGWRSLVTVGGKEFFSKDQVQANRGVLSDDAGYLTRFHIPFDVSSDSNVGEIKIYNLSAENVAVFKRNQPVRLEAGYHPFEKHRELVLDGVIEDLIVEPLDKVTRVLTIQMGDATDRWPVRTTTRAFGPGVLASVVARDLIAAAGLAVGKIDPTVDPVYRKGLSLVGAIRPELETVAKDMHSKLHVSRGKVYILRPDKGIPSGVTLSAENGLLAAQPAMALPSDFQYVEDWHPGEKPQVYEVRALLTPKLWADSEFDLDGCNLQGKFRVVAGSHDCTGRDFLTTVRVAEA